MKLFAFRYQKRVYNIIDDVLEWSPSLALSGMMEKQQTVVNTTDPNNNFTDGTKESTEKVVHPNDMDEEIFSEQQVDEDDIRNVEDTESPSTSQWCNIIEHGIWEADNRLQFFSFFLLNSFLVSGIDLFECRTV